MTKRSLPELIDDVVVGLASEEDIARLETLAAENPDIAFAIARARQRFLALDETADELPLPEGFWERLNAKLDDRTEVPNDDTPGNVVDMAAMRGKLRRWRLSALSSIAASVALVAVLGWSTLSRQDVAVIAVLLNDQGEAVALVEAMEDNTTRVTLLEQAEVPSEMVMQVWTKPEDTGPPVSLGLLESGTSRTLTVDGLPTPHLLQLYEITTEPAGGSPTNLPTGPILGKGLAKVPVI